MQHVKQECEKRELEKVVECISLSASGSIACVASLLAKRVGFGGVFLFVCLFCCLVCFFVIISVS